MSGAYPHFKLSYTHEELVEHFLLTPADLGFQEQSAENIR
jgi:hypothetical protein